MRFNRTLPSALLAAMILAACGGGDTVVYVPTEPTAPVVQGTVVTAAQMNDTDLNAIFAAAKEGDTVTLPPGKYSFKGPLQITNKKKITVLGAGNGTDPTSNTILSFAKALAQNGIDAAGLDTVTFKKFAIEDASGNGVFVNQSKNVVMDTLRTEWMINPFGTSKMVYGLYPVSSDNVKIVNSKAVGTRDAGVYVGQSTNILVAKNTVVNNVAGIEIENSYNAIVEDNDVYDNTGGILVFALKAPPRFKTTEERRGAQQPDHRQQHAALCQRQRPGADHSAGHGRDGAGFAERGGLQQHDHEAQDDRRSADLRLRGRGGRQQRHQGQPGQGRTTTSARATMCTTTPSRTLATRRAAPLPSRAVKAG
jgi:parallel beta-helix repeat protein